MIEKFFGGCQSERNKINELIDAVNEVSGGEVGMKLVFQARI